MRMVDVIAKKRDGKELTKEEIEFLLKDILQAIFRITKRLV